MGDLKEKIIGLFIFPPEAELSLTYIDEDGDVVTLIDDADLWDVMSQRLKFLRIDVQLKCDRDGKSNARSSENSTPLRTPQVQPDLSNFNTDAAEVLKAIPEPLREAMSKSLDLASIAASSYPVVGDYVDLFSKVGQSFLNQVSQSPSDPELNDLSGAMGNVASSVPTDSPSNECRVQDVFLKYTTSNKTTKAEDIAKVSKGVSSPAFGVDLNLDPSCDSNPRGSATLNSAPPCDKKSSTKIAGAYGDKAPMPSSTIPARSSDQHIPYIPHDPFSGLPFVNHVPVPYVGNPFKRSCSRIGSSSATFHKGVRCDGCGIHPITGPRFKSKVKEDYDLCIVCFTKMGTEADYIRIDRPISYRHSRSLRAHGHHPWALYPGPPHHVKSLLKPIRHKLDSRFVMDVNIFDGTRMTPSTPFTKIWKMRNNASIPWPQGLQLLWIGGDKFSDSVLAEIQVPVGGVPVNGELDIAVDFTAPAAPGRYISYWRMSSPTGIKFGQRVWVLIQVDASWNESLCDGFQGLNLNFPPATSGGSSGPKTFDVNVQPEVNASVEMVEPIVNEVPKRDEDLNFPINDSLLVGNAIAASAPPASSSVSYPYIDLSDATIPDVPLNTESPVNDVRVPSSTEEVEQSLLMELEQMGFKEMNLNKEVLRMNQYDLERSVDDLCGVTEWDPILDELMEMGFVDAETNKKLLKKNNGSIKRVVMDLLSEQKP
jgi:next-to-BRCA1 protein 1